MEEEGKGGKDPIIQKNNSGEVYYNGNDKKQTNFTLGEVECKTCNQLKPFEQVRWNRTSGTFSCLTCFPDGE